jgi:hypothetical protein
MYKYLCEAYLFKLADARALIRLLAQGIDPRVKAEADRAAAELEKAERAANSFESVAEDFIKRHVLAEDKGRPKLKSGAEVAATIRREIVPKWRGRLITDIARRDVVKLLENVVDDGRASVAHHLLAYLSKLFNWAIARDAYGLQASPVTRGMAKDIIGAKKPRQRVLSAQEMVEVWKASADCPPPSTPSCACSSSRASACVKWPTRNGRRSISTPSFGQSPPRA